MVVDVCAACSLICLIVFFIGVFVDGLFFLLLNYDWFLNLGVFIPVKISHHKMGSLTLV